MFPKISIVTPVFNQKYFLERTILSILNQNYPNLEYIIIDGGSTDGSVEIIRKYADKLAYWVSEPDGGMYEAIRKGFEHSTGDIMAWLNADDLYYPQTFNTVSTIFQQNTDVNWILGALSMIGTEDQSIAVNQSQKWSKYRFLNGDFRWIQQEAVFWKRSLWEQAGGLNPNLKLAGDFDLWLRFFRHTRLHTVDSLLGAFRLRGGNQLSVAQQDKYLLEVADCLKNEKLNFQETLQKYICKFYDLGVLLLFRNHSIFRWIQFKLHGFAPRIVFEDGRWNKENSRKLFKINRPTQ